MTMPPQETGPRNAGARQGTPSMSIKDRLRRLVRTLRLGLAFLLRHLARFMEKTVPPVGRCMRGWSWIWQPTVTHRWLNEYYAKTEDPYNFASSPYEAEKYAHTMRLLGGRTYERALEVGAAEGVFTEILAPHCREVLAIELADAAVARARDRLAHLEHVRVIQGTLPEDMPEGPFDLIVASDVLYHFPGDVLTDFADQMDAALMPGGTLFALHYLATPNTPIDGGRAHALLKRHLKLELVHEETVQNVGPRGGGYMVTILRKRVKAAPGGRPT